MPGLTAPSGVFTPPVQRNVSTFPGGPRAPVFAHDGRRLNAVFCDTLTAAGVTSSRLSIQFGSGGAVATYNPGSTFVSELMAF